MACKSKKKSGSKKKKVLDFMVLISEAITL